MTTALEIKEEDGSVKRLLFMTVQKLKGGVDVDLFLANTEFMPIGTASLGVSELNEVEYHVNLRKQASEKGQFVPDFSTDPELNPDYKNEETGSI